MNLPNRLTLTRIILIPVFLFFAQWPIMLETWRLEAWGSSIPWPLLVCTVIFVLASVTDWLDGWLARRYHLVTNFGKFADPIADKMLVMTALISLVQWGQASAWIVSLIVMRQLAISGLRLILVENGQVLAAQMAGKIKTATQMLAIILLLLDDWPFGFLPFSLGRLCLLLALLLTLYSGGKYLYDSRHIFKF